MPKTEATTEHPLVTVDIVIFTVENHELKVLLVKRKFAPFKDDWALPGGFVLANESLDTAAARELFEETGVKDVYLEQLYSFGEPKRDPRQRVITIAYFALVNSRSVRLQAASDAAEANWFSLQKLPDLAFDHEKIVSYAVQRLRWKLEYTTVAYSLLPERFSLTELQKVYETILGKTFDTRNFRKKIVSLGLLKDSGHTKTDVAHRPAKLYSFKKKKPEIIEIL